MGNECQNESCHHDESWHVKSLKGGPEDERRECVFTDFGKPQEAQVCPCEDFEPKDV